MEETPFLSDILGLASICSGMDLTPVKARKEVEGSDQSQDPQIEAEAILKRRVVALIETVTYVLFSYVAQVVLSFAFHNGVQQIWTVPLALVPIHRLFECRPRP